MNPKNARLFVEKVADFFRKGIECVNLVGLVKSVQTSIHLAKFGVDTAENELLKVCQKLTKTLS